jgi:hypothetical protein
MPQYLALCPERAHWWRLAETYSPGAVQELIQAHWASNPNDPLRLDVVLGSDEIPSEVLINPSNITAVAVVEESPKRVIRF